MKKVLVIGASGFLGRHVAQALLAQGYAVRCLARNPDRVQDLAANGCEMVRGDISDFASLQGALESVQAVYISIHTLSPQHADTAGQGFMDIEMNGLRNIVRACEMHGVRRLIYVTSLGIAPDGPGAWIRERWKAEQFLLNSGLHATVIRPGQIVGVGGRGFDMMAAQAKRRVAFVMSGNKKTRGIAVDDLTYYLVGVLDDPRANGQCYDVGCDDLLTNNQMLDVAAEVLGREHPMKIPIPRTLLSALAPLIERVSKLPRGAFKGLMDGMKADLNADPGPIRSILPGKLLRYRQAVERALSASGVSRG